jgi:hypothetical protein
MSPTILPRRYAPAASVQSVALPHAFGLPAIVAGWTWCATSTASAAAAGTATTTMHSPTHRRLSVNVWLQSRSLPARGRMGLEVHRCLCIIVFVSTLRQALRRKRCTARPLFTRPAWPRRALRSHDHQRAPRKLSVSPTILPRRCAPAASVLSSYLTL